MFRIIIGSVDCCGDRGSYITVGLLIGDVGWLTSRDLRTESTPARPRPLATGGRAGAPGEKIPGEKGDAMTN